MKQNDEILFPLKFKNEWLGKIAFLVCKWKPKRKMWMCTSKSKTILNYQGGLQFKKLNVK